MEASVSDHCESCGVAWTDHVGIVGACRELKLCQEQLTASQWLLEERGRQMAEMQGKLEKAQERMKGGGK
jgi:hypothetical protein